MNTIYYNFVYNSSTRTLTCFNPSKATLRECTEIIIIYFYTNIDVHSLRGAGEGLKHVGVLVL
jgi:hypothetical protein